MSIVAIDGIPVFQAIVDSEDCGMFRISLVDDPAVQSNFLAFKDAPRKMMYSVQDEDKHLVLGVVMRADFPIYRKEPELGEFYIIYKADTIRTMAEKYLAENRQNLVNLMHKDGSEVEGVQMVQYFIKGGGINPEGFKDIADGSLFAEFHITNEEVWQAVKDGTYRGFSLEGVFDLEPERNADEVQSIVDSLKGIFKRITHMSKVKGLMARLAEALAEESRVETAFGNVSTDRGILAWEGEEDLKQGDAVYIEDEAGERSPAPDGDYITADGKVIAVADGKVSEIRDDAAQVAPQEEKPAAEEMGRKETDKGAIEWDGEDDLKEGDEVFVTDEEGNRVAAPDGDYTTDDGKVISVVDGKVASIADPEAEVAPAEEMRMRRIAQAFEESYRDKEQRIYEAIRAKLGDRADYAYLADAGDDFAVINLYDPESGEEKFIRYAVSWDEEGNASLDDGIEVVPAFVTPEEREAADETMRTLQAEKETLMARIQELERKPAAKPAHEEFEGVAKTAKTGNKGLDRLARVMSAK